jgi:hypothetical protein
VCVLLFELLAIPALMKCFESINSGKPYTEQIKPFNFLTRRGGS